ncbi:MAG: sodium:calcium antiporter [Halobacteriales archaeon]|nr:sodium:calcium antiporter [Halobacteriales archaeon]
MLPAPAVTIPFVSEAVGNTILLVGSFLLLLLGAEVFTNGVEWFGHRLGVSESATGSILAAVGTALPETMIPVIAIIQQQSGGGTAADEVGVGAILGAPFMLATIAMFLVGGSVLYFRGRRRFGAEMHFNSAATRRDLSFFLVGYSLAFITALVPSRTFDLAVGALLVVLYLIYVWRSLASGELIEHEGLDDLHLGLILEEGLERIPGPYPNKRHRADPGTLLVGLQTLIALGIIIGGAHLFVQEVQWAAQDVLGIPAAVVALLLAPLATELPEKFNSVLWISRDKDTLALGNITGAMAFQGTLPVTLGIVFTSWNLSLSWGTTGFLNGFSAVLAIVSGGILYLRARSVGDGNMLPRPFLLGGLFYLLFIAVLVYHVLVFDLSVGAHG